MDAIDVFVRLSDDERTNVSLAVKALKSRLKTPVAEWFLVGPRSERLERLAYDLGLRAVVQVSSESWTSPAQAHGQAAVVVFWSTDAVLVGDWQPVQGAGARLWESCPAAVVRRSDLTSPAQSWEELRSLSSLTITALPPAQVKVLPLKEFEKIAHNPPWPFGPSVVILEKA